MIEGVQPVPVEVKAGKSGTLKSLHLFLKEKPSDVSIRLNTDLPSLMKGEHILADGRKKTYQLLSLPLYMAGQVRRLIAPNELLLGK